MGASPSQRAAAVDLGRRCAAWAEALSPPSEQTGHTWERNSMSAADIARALDERAARQRLLPRDRGADGSSILGAGERCQACAERFK
jgi:hypothetical protein